MFEELSEEIESQIEKFREQYGIGGTFVSIFSDGIVVPWKPLSLYQYLKYSELAQKGKLSVHLEDEIFLLCVLDDTLKRQIDYLRAGTVQTVVQHIWQLSCPSSADELNQQINNRREQTWSAHNAIIHEFVKWITLAFPYKPEELYAMSFDQLVRILVLAEQKLSLLGLLDKPFQASIEGEQSQQTMKKPDPKKVWEEIHGIESPDSSFRDEVLQEKDAQEELRHKAMAKRFSRMPSTPSPPPHPFGEGEKDNLLRRAQGKEPRKNWRKALQQAREQPKRESVLLPPEQLPPEMLEDPKVSPIIKYGGSKDAKKIDFAIEELSALCSLTGHEMMDLDIDRELMVRDAQKHYSDVLKYLADRREEVARKKK